MYFGYFDVLFYVIIIQITFPFFSWIVCLCLLIWRNSKEIFWRQILCFHIVLCLFYIKKTLFNIHWKSILSLFSCSFFSSEEKLNFTSVNIIYLFLCFILFVSYFRNLFHSEIINISAILFPLTLHLTLSY